MTTTPFDFSKIKGLNTFWDGGEGATGWGGHNFNTYTTGSDLNIGSNLDKLYQGMLGRNADRGGKKYWSDAIKAGDATYQSVADAINASKEKIDQVNYVAANPNATAADLTALGTAHIDPYHWGSGSAVANWKPGDPLTEEIAAAVTTDPNVPTSNYGDQTNFNVNDVWKSIINSENPPWNPGGGGGGTMQPYDDSGLLATISGLQGELGSLRTAFDDYKKDMEKMWANANWGSGTSQQQSTVQGVKTQNELPGWTPKTGGSSGFFGRGNRFGLTTGSLNI